MTINLKKIEPIVIVLLLISQLSNYTILNFFVHIPRIELFKYLCFFLPLIYLIKGFKLEWRMLFVISILSTTIVINEIDPKFNSELRFFMWIIMIAMIGPLLYSSKLNEFKENLLNSFLYIFMILGAISFFYWILGFPSLGRGNFSGVFTHSMVLAPISSMGVIYSIYRLYIENKIMTKYYFAFLFLFNFLALILSASRSALVATILSIFVFLFFAKIKLKKIFFSLTILLALISNSYLNINFSNSSLTEKLANRGYDNTREILWHDRLLEFESSPFFGVGFAAQDDNIDGKIGKKGSDEGVVEPGSAYLMILSMTGLIGALSLFVFFLKYLTHYSFWKNNLLNINYKPILVVFFLIHFIAEGYIFSTGSIFSFVFWLLVAITYPNKINNKEIAT